VQLVEQIVNNAQVTQLALYQQDHAPLEMLLPLLELVLVALLLTA